MYERRRRDLLRQRARVLLGGGRVVAVADVSIEGRLHLELGRYRAGLSPIWGRVGSTSGIWLNMLDYTNFCLRSRATNLPYTAKISIRLFRWRRRNEIL